MGYKVEWDEEGFDDENPVFDTEAEAESYAADQLNNYNVGGEVLHLSNPGDNPGEWDEPGYMIVEVDD